jgi:hypothetical protein
MRRSLFLSLTFLWPLMALADVQWHEFGRSPADKETFSIGHLEFTVEQQTNSESAFQGDDLILTIRNPSTRHKNQYWFTSSYGFASVAVYRNILLLKYGIGRGTAGARVEHIKILRLDHDLDEMADVQCSYYIVTNPHNASPDEFDCRLRVQAEGDYTTFTFWLPKPLYGLPSDKIVRIKMVVDLDKLQKLFVQ